MKNNLPLYDEDAIMMHWSDFVGKIQKPKKTKKKELPLYDEDAIMMHWSDFVGKIQKPKKFKGKKKLDNIQEEIQDEKLAS